MARVFICLARNDIPAESLQITDLKPRSEHARRGSSSFGKGGQTGYIAFLPQSNDTAAATPGGVLTVQDNPEYGLAAYLMDNVEDQTGDIALTVARANATKDAIMALVAAGSPVTLAAVNNALVANGVANAGGGTELIGAGASNSTGVLEEVLRILSGEVYRVPVGAVSIAAGGFLAARQGAFVTTPELETSFSVSGLQSGGAVRGRSPFGTPVVPSEVPVQTGTQDLTFRNVRRILDTGDLHRSAQTGVLSKLKAATYEWVNSSFTYNGGAVPAQDVAGNNIGVNHQGRAVVVYDATGALI
jgi:hypothetical protein